MGSNSDAGAKLCEYSTVLAITITIVNDYNSHYDCDVIILSISEIRSLIFCIMVMTDF